MKLILTWVLNALALMAVAWLLPGVVVQSFGTALIAALVLGLINTVVRPLLVVLTLPLTVVTLGVFYFVLNGFLFYGVGSVLRGFEVQGFWWAVLAALLYSIFAALLTKLAFQKPVRIEQI